MRITLDRYNPFEYKMDRYNPAEYKLKRKKYMPEETDILVKCGNVLVKK